MHYTILNILNSFQKTDVAYISSNDSIGSSQQDFADMAVICHHYLLYDTFSPIPTIQIFTGEQIKVSNSKLSASTHPFMLNLKDG